MEFRVCGGWGPNSPRGLYGRDCQSWSLQRGGRRQQKGRNPAEGRIVHTDKPIPLRIARRSGVLSSTHPEGQSLEATRRSLGCSQQQQYELAAGKGYWWQQSHYAAFSQFECPHSGFTTPKYQDHTYTKPLLFSLFMVGHGPVLLPTEKAWEQQQLTAGLCSQELTKTWQMYPAETAWHV